MSVSEAIYFAAMMTYNKHCSQGASNYLQHAGNGTPVVVPHTIKKCVSIAYNKPAKTGSSTVGRILSEKYPKAKRVDCGAHSENSSLGKLLLPKNSQYDIFDCHSIWNATMVSALVEQAKHPLVHLTTFRDPAEQAVSLYFHLKKHIACNTTSGEVPTLADMVSFVDGPYNRRVKSFHSRPYDISQLSEKLAREECAFWDVIWPTEQLNVALASKRRFNTRSKSKCPEKSATLEDEDLMSAVREATQGERRMFEGLQNCEKVRTDNPWEWDEELGCIVSVE